MKKQTLRDHIMNICLTAEQVVSSADNTGCDGDLTVASKKAIDKLDKAVKAFYSSKTFNQKG